MHPLSHTAFFYGTLMAPKVLSRVIGRPVDTASPSDPTALHIQPALLHGHVRHRVRKADYPAVIPTPAAPASAVRGTLVTGLAPADLRRLDVFEGDEYVRMAVDVAVGEDVVQAETYIWVAGRDRLEDDEWDFEEFVRDKMWRWAAGEGDEGFRELEGLEDGTGGRAVGGGFEERVG